MVPLLPPALAQLNNSIILPSPRRLVNMQTLNCPGGTRGRKPARGPSRATTHYGLDRELSRIGLPAARMACSPGSL